MVTNAKLRTPHLKVERPPGIAPGRSTWQEDILLVNYSREIKRGLETRCLQACYYNKEQTPLQGIFAVQPQVFRGGRFGVLGTPPPKPLNCKVWENPAGAHASHASHAEAL
jgi:hypothetical protein